MLGFLIGLMTGGFFGVVVMAMLNVASKTDKDLKSEEK